MHMRHETQLSNFHSFIQKMETSGSIHLYLIFKINESERELFERMIFFKRYNNSFNSST